MLQTYTLTRKHDFIYNMRERLRASKYIDGSVLMRDLFALKTHFKGEAPTENGRDSLDFTEALSSIDKKRENLQVNSIKRKLKIDDDEISTNMKAAKLAFPMCQPQPQPQFLIPIYIQCIIKCLSFQMLILGKCLAHLTRRYKDFLPVICFPTRVWNQNQNPMEILAEAALKHSPINYDADDDESDFWQLYPVLVFSLK